MAQSMRARRKPIIMEVWQWDGQTPTQDRPYWLRDRNVYSNLEQGILSISLLGTVAIAMPGDWIIRGVNGEIYPIKGNVFDETYEIVKE